MWLALSNQVHQLGVYATSSRFSWLTGMNQWVWLSIIQFPNMNNAHGIYSFKHTLPVIYSKYKVDSFWAANHFSLDRLVNSSLSWFLMTVGTGWIQSEENACQFNWKSISRWVISKELVRILIFLLVLRRCFKPGN